MGYQIVTDATCDLNQDFLEDYDPVLILPMNVMIGEDAYVYGGGGNLTVDHFYQEQRNGKFCSTSQITPMYYREAFEKILDSGMDLIYLGFSSGLSNSYNNAKICLEGLREKYPDRKIYILDTLDASTGLGLLVMEAVRKKAAGMTVDEMAEWAERVKLHVAHWFTVDNFVHLRHGGRVSSAAAAVGTVLNIKPMLRIDEEGKLEVIEKPRGNKKAMQAQIARFRQSFDPEESKLVLIGNGDNLSHAEELKALVLSEHPEAEVHITSIGPVIGSHTGPGMCSLCHFGKIR